MPAYGKVRAEVAALWQRVAKEQERATRAAELAARYDEAAERGPESQRPLRRRMAALHRRTEVRHRTSARLQELHAVRLQNWIDGANLGIAQPAFIAAVAAALDANSAALTMVDPRGTEAVVAASDDIARAAHDLEFVIGEGPGRDAIRATAPVAEEGDAFRARWPEFSRAATGLGVHAVLAVPLLLPTACVGALCVYEQTDIRQRSTAATEQVADALARAVFTPVAELGDTDMPAVRLVGDADYPAVVHQAAGMVSVDRECAVEDAMALLRARAFADGRTAEQIATLVVHDRMRLR